MFATAWLLLAAAVGAAMASEYPERECCDPVDPPPATVSATTSDYAAAAGHEVPPPTATAIDGHREEKTPTGSLNCLLARSLCNEDPSCFKIINLIPSLCGNEIVSCSTTTVIKCRAALKTLQAFPFFKPTCLCREPKIDYECNSFRNFLFDHPCNFTQRKEYDQFHIETLASCNHALTVCESSSDCRRIFEDFKNNCKVTKDNTCETNKPEECHRDWLRLRKTPLFGCICTQNQVKKRCDRIFSMINENPCISSKSTPIDNSILNFQSTCHEALETCNKHPQCQEMVASIIRNCNHRQCKKDNCMESLQNFYRNESMHSYAIEIAFCLCKKSGVNKDKCLIAQEMLHPECAQRADGPAKVPCHFLAESCRAKSNCRSRLEAFEQTCSVDQTTSRCAGPPSTCRESILGILGTMLRTNCACKDTSPSKFYDCMGWQRVFWFNSCVVEAQRDFHMTKIKDSVKLLSRHFYTTTAVPVDHYDQTTAIAVRPLSSAVPSTEAMVVQTTTTVRVLIAGKKFRPDTMTTAVTTPKASTTSVATTAVTTSISTVSTTASSTLSLASQIPLRGCSLQRSPHYNKQFMSEGDVIRLHSLEDNSCSEVCHCKTGESLTCQTICVEVEPCETEIAYYHHESPAYIAFRGRCVCYVGRFICMRPKMGSYTLVPGVFLFLGYSEKDEQLLKSLDIMNFEIKDIVYTIQKFIQEHMVFNTTCKLQLHSISFENMIIMGKASQKLTTGGYLKNDATDIRSSVLQDNMACFEILKNFSYMVTTQAMQVKTNMLLSVLKIAEVDILLPVSNSRSANLSPDTCTATLLLVIIAAVVII
uniref:GDNF family receptor alpha-3 n=1 Tax=Schizaphis graminum TaxID=13262 RepID=A0A2S2NAC9_SCHGA